jgi:hypothetical protein
MVHITSKAAGHSEPVREFEFALIEDASGRLKNPIFTRRRDPASSGRREESKRSDAIVPRLKTHSVLERSPEET